MDVGEREVCVGTPALQAHICQVCQADVGLQLAFCPSVKLHRFGQEIREVRQVGIEVQRQVEAHIAQQVMDLSFRRKSRLFGFRREVVEHDRRVLTLVEVECGISVEFEVTKFVRKRLIGSFAVFERQVGIHQRHLGVVIDTFGGSVQLEQTIHVDVRERRSELSRHKRQERFDLPFACLQRYIQEDVILHIHRTFEAQREVIDREISTVEGKMHRVQVHRQRCDDFEVQTVGVGITLKRRTDVMGVEFDEHIIPTLRFGTQLRFAKRGGDGIFVIHKRDIVGVQAETVHAQGVERQREGRRVFCGGIRRRGNNTREVGGSIRCDIEIHSGMV